MFFFLLQTLSTLSGLPDNPVLQWQPDSLLWLSGPSRYYTETWREARRLAKYVAVLRLNTDQSIVVRKFSLWIVSNRRKQWSVCLSVLFCCPVMSWFMFFVCVIDLPVGGYLRANQTFSNFLLTNGSLSPSALDQLFRARLNFQVVSTAVNHTLTPSQAKSISWVQPR